MSSAPLMPEPASLAGAWRLDGPAGDCVVTLLQADRPLTAGSLGAPMMAAELACEGLDEVVGWRPVPLGLALTDAEGRSVVTFERTGASEYTSTDQTWRLSRD